MTEPFDPYLTWLGIRRTEAGIDHYRLLGLERFESDLIVIANASQRQIQHVKTFIEGNHAQIANALIVELTEARDCLSDAHRKADYDRKLGAGANTESVVGESNSGDSPAFDFGDQVATRSEPDLSGLDVESRKPHSSGRGGPGIAVSASKRRRKQRSAASDIFGWLFGAVAAVVFAYIILNTDLIDKIRGVVSSDVNSELDDPDFDNRTNDPVERSAGKLRRDRKQIQLGGSVISAEPTKDLNSNSKESRNDRVKEADGVLNGLTGDTSTKTKNTNQPEPTTRKVKAAPVIKIDLPAADMIRRASVELKGAFTEQFKSNSRDTKRNLATTLLRDARREDLPEKVVATIDAVTELAVETGDLGFVVSAIDLKAAKFNVEYWIEIQPPTQQAIANCLDFETIAEAFEALIEKGRAAERFKLCSELSSRAQRHVKKLGDVKQAEMLAALSKDMKALAVLQKSYQQIQSSGSKPRSKRDNLVLGKYTCYGKQDWDTGLRMLKQGSDAAMAQIAAAELDSADQAGSLVMRQWLTLAQDKKYDGLDRRCLLERILYRLDNEFVPDLDSSQIRYSLLNQTQFVKKFVDDPQAGSRIVKFTKVVVDNTELGDIDFSRGRNLVFRRGNQLIRLRVQKSGVNYTAQTQDGRFRFLVRFLSNGWVEMRIRDMAAQRWTIWYGQ